MKENGLFKQRDLLSSKEVSEILGLSRRTLARYEEQGILKPVKLNSRVIRYYRNEIEDMLANLKKGAAPNVREAGLQKAIESLKTGLRIYEGTRKAGMTESQLTMVSGMKASLAIALEELEK